MTARARSLAMLRAELDAMPPDDVIAGHALVRDLAAPDALAIWDAGRDRALRRARDAVRRAGR